MPKAVVTHRAEIRGQVQGVGFRWAAADEARRLRLDGTVRNYADGRVEAIYSGREESVAAFEDWLRTGPPLARVDSVEISVEGGPPVEGGFRIL